MKPLRLCTGIAWVFFLGMERFKAVHNQYFILTMDQIKLRNVEVAACSAEPTKNYHPTLQPHSAPLSFLASFNSLFSHNFTVVKF